MAVLPTVSSREPILPKTRAVGGQSFCALDPGSPIPCNQTCYDPNGFDFTSLQTIVEKIFQSCHYDERLARLPNGEIRTPPALTVAAAYQIAGSEPTRYPYSDFYNRITTWKIPLLQLAALFPRPPLGKSVEFFVFMRLLGNPIGTLQDLLLKVASCQGRALYWKEFFQDPKYERYLLDESINNGESASFRSYERHWKAFSIIVDSCDEWGRERGNYTQRALTVLLEELLLAEDKSMSGSDLQKATQIRKQCLESFLRTAGALAADRGTKIFPVAVALGLFLVVIMVAFVRTSFSSEGTIFVNVEIYSVAFSALYFWIISIVQIGAAVGCSQTENAIARILNRLQREINSILSANRVAAITPGAMQTVHLLDGITEGEVSNTSWTRKTSGGIYSWQPTYWVSLSDLLAGRSNNKLEQIKYEISSRYDKLHSQPWFLDFPTTFHPNPAQFACNWKLSKWQIPLAWVGCVTLGTIFICFRVFSWILGLSITPIRFLLGPIVPGSPILPLLVVSSGLFTSWALSMRIPPQNEFSCRPKWELYLFISWVLSWLLDYLSVKKSWIVWIYLKLPKLEQNREPARMNPVQRQVKNSITKFENWTNKTNENEIEHTEHFLRFYTGLLKDILVVIWGFSNIVVTQWGVMNEPQCYIDPTNTFLVLPGNPEVANTLRHRLWREYLTLVLVLIVLQLLIIPCTIAWQFLEALQVFIQRDDEKSHCEWNQKLRCKYLKPWGNRKFPILNYRHNRFRGNPMRWWTGMPRFEYIPQNLMKQSVEESFRKDVNDLLDPRKRLDSTGVHNLTSWSFHDFGRFDEKEAVEHDFITRSGDLKNSKRRSSQESADSENSHVPLISRQTSNLSSYAPSSPETSIPMQPVYTRNRRSTIQSEDMFFVQGL